MAGHPGLSGGGPSLPLYAHVELPQQVRVRRSLSTLRLAPLGRKRGFVGAAPLSTREGTYCSHVAGDFQARMHGRADVGAGRINAREAGSLAGQPLKVNEAVCRNCAKME